MEIYEIAYLFVGLATLVASGTIINYSRKRSAATPDPEIKKAFRPLYLFAVGLIIFAIGALLTYYELLVGVPFIQIHEVTVVGTNYYVLYYITLIELVFLAISAAIIMQQRIIGLFMILMIIIAYLLMFNAITILEDSRVSSTAESYIDFGYILTMIIFGAVAFLFSWIAYDTKRSTSLALGYAMIVQVFAIPRLFNLLPPEILLVITILVLMGPAMIAFAFLRPDQKISGELVGYGASFAAPVIVITGLLISAYTADFVIMTIGIVGAIAIMFTAGAASYSYGRWRETKQTPTALLMVVFASFSAGQVIGILGSVGSFDKDISIYFDLVASSFALVIFSVFAILAAGYRTTATIPLMIYIPAIIFTASAYPAPISEAISTWWFLVLPVMVLFFIPVIIFFRVWRRMTRAGTVGRMRPLGLSLGLLVYILIRFPLMLIDFEPLDPSYGLIIIGFFVLWLSITGRLDKIRQ